MAKPTYEARAARSGRWWSIEVRQLHGVHAQARRLDQVEAMAREAISVALEAAGDSFDVAIQIDSTSLGALRPTIEEAVRAREAADKAQSRASEAMRRAVAETRASGYTSRDAGMLLGVSNQRISQIEHQIGGADMQKLDDVSLEDRE
jgi:hypothetical protein